MPDYGYDISGGVDLTPGLSDIDGNDNTRIMLQVCTRRLLTPIGGLLSAPDEDTIDLREYVSAGLTETELYNVRSAITTALLADERVESVNVSIQYDRQTEIMSVQIDGFGALGPFDLTLSVSQVNLEVLEA